MIRSSVVDQMVEEAAMALILDDFHEARDMAEIAVAAAGFRYSVHQVLGDLRICAEYLPGMPDAKAAVFVVDTDGSTRFLYGDVDGVVWPPIPTRYIHEVLLLRHYGGVTA